MATYALVRNGVVVNLIVADQNFVNSVSGQYDAVLKSEGGVGWVYDGAKIGPPVPVAPVPVVSRVVPNSGVVASAVTIYGSGFTGATGVTFGGAAATNVAVVSDSQITCVTPAQLLKGDLAVVVATSAGANAAAPMGASDPSNFRYI